VRELFQLREATPYPYSASGAKERARGHPPPLTSPQAHYGATWGNPEARESRLDMLDFQARAALCNT
jgi:hypothetical protein